MMDDYIGSLEPGKDADVLLIDRRGETQLSPPAAMIPNLVLGNGPSPDSIARVMVRGRTIVQDGEHVSVDRRQAVQRLDDLQQVLLDECDARLRLGSDQPTMTEPPDNKDKVFHNEASHYAWIALFLPQNRTLRENMRSCTGLLHRINSFAVKQAGES